MTLAGVGGGWGLDEMPNADDRPDTPVSGNVDFEGVLSAFSSTRNSPTRWGASLGGLMPGAVYPVSFFFAKLMNTRAAQTGVYSF
jgi:hypothetical protein